MSKAPLRRSSDRQSSEEIVHYPRGQKEPLSSKSGPSCSSSKAKWIAITALVLVVLSLTVLITTQVGGTAALLQVLNISLSSKVALGLVIGTSALAGLNIAIALAACILGRAIKLGSRKVTTTFQLPPAYPADTQFDVSEILKMEDFEFDFTVLLEETKIPRLPKEARKIKLEDILILLNQHLDNIPEELFKDSELDMVDPMNNHENTSYDYLKRFVQVIKGEKKLALSGIPGGKEGDNWRKNQSLMLKHVIFMLQNLEMSNEEQKSIMYNTLANLTIAGRHCGARYIEELNAAYTILLPYQSNPCYESGLTPADDLPLADKKAITNLSHLFSHRLVNEALNKLAQDIWAGQDKSKQPEDLPHILLFIRKTIGKERAMTGYNQSNVGDGWTPQNLPDKEELLQQFDACLFDLLKNEVRQNGSTTNELYAALEALYMYHSYDLGTGGVWMQWFGGSMDDEGDVTCSSNTIKETYLLQMLRYLGFVKPAQ